MLHVDNPREPCPLEARSSAVKSTVVTGHDRTGQMGHVTVLHLRASPFMGSPERMLIGQMDHVDQTCCQYVLGVLNEQRGPANDFVRQFRARGGTAYTLHQSAMILPLTIFAIVRIVRMNRIGVICTHDYKSNLCGMVAGLLTRVPVIAAFHGRTSQDWRMRLYEQLDNYVQRYAKAIVSVSEATRTQLVSLGLRPERVRVIANGVDLRSVRQGMGRGVREEFGLDEKDRIVTFAGRFSREKGLHVLAAAAARVKSAAGHVKFLIVGDGPERPALRKLVEHLGVKDDWIMPGFRHDAARFLLDADICVLPSLTEGLPLMVLEAYACAKPVIASRVGGLPEVVEDRKTGLLVEPGSADALAEGLMYLLRNPGMAIEMGRAGYERVSARFTAERQARAYVDLFLEVAKQYGSRPSVEAYTG